MIDTLPWEQLQPFEGVSVCVFPSPERNLRRTNDDLDDYVQRCRQIPENILKEIEPCFNPFGPDAGEDETGKKEEGEKVFDLDPNKEAFIADKPFPPDDCDLTVDSGRRASRLH